MTLNYTISAGPRPANSSPTATSSGNTATASLQSCTHPHRVWHSSSRTADSVSDSPMLSAPSSSKHSFLSFGRNGKSSQPEQPTSSLEINGPFEFLPSVSFDDLHTSIESAAAAAAAAPTPASSSFDLTPTPPSSTLDPSPPLHDPKMHNKQNAGPNASTTRVSLQSLSVRPGRSGSILHRPSTATRQTSNSSIVSSNSSSTDANSSASTATRTRRSTTVYPPVSTSSTSIAAKTVRKVMVAGSASAIGASSVADSDASVKRAGSKRRTAHVSDRCGDSGQSKTDSGSESLCNGSASRASKMPKSSQASPMASQSTLASSSALSLDQSRLSGTHKSPRTSVKPTTPSAGRRQSVAPGAHASHATGLGARTISPTDTRRLKRMSMMTQSSNPPALTNHHPPPPPPVTMEARAASRSPSMIPRKTSGRSGRSASGTPSSSRTTPDTNRKSYSSGLSGASAVSFNTVRTSTGSLQPRLPQSASQSRLPAPKHTAAHNALPAEDDEDVPPVPAIPKAFESPRDSCAESCSTTDKRKSNLTQLESLSSHNSSSASIATTGNADAFKSQRETTVRKVGVAKATGAENGQPGSLNKKNLEPLRLPPLNLAPLSMPTSAKLDALKDQGLDRNMSPPLSRQIPKTPTTPLTASKSSFFSKVGYDETIEMPSLRSSTSIHRSRVAPTPPDATSSSDSSSFLRDADRKTMSPFLSSSLPKGSELGGPLRRTKTGGDPPTAHGSMFEQRTPSKPSGPRPPHTGHLTARSPPPMPSLEEARTPSSVSSLRRKLSESWSKRAASKSGIIIPADLTDMAGKSAMKHDHHAVPRIPTSATTGALNHMGQEHPSSTSASVNPSSYFLESRRRKSSNASLTNLAPPDRSKKDHAVDANPNPIVPLSSSRSASVVHRLIRPKSSGSTLQNAASYTASKLDNLDELANEEMRKLGLGRKETEIAARTLDALKKRASPKERVSSQEAIRIAMLNIYERGEIIDYDSVYFCGTQNAHKVVGDLHSDLPNFGYDDERGDYAIVIGDHIAYRYEIVDVLGKGSFGQVVRCIDHKNGSLVAVKIIRNKKRFHQQALVEVKILEKLHEWDPKHKHSMVSFTDSFYFRGHLCISTELLDMNLYEFIKAHSFRGFSLRIIRRFTKQILSSLILLKQHKVIHCDLKPENILLRHPLHSEIKVIDFGSSCFESEKVYTYIQSRFYRSPEVILGMTYGLPIDMWSVGCILAELYTGVPIFPGENEQEQLACIMEVFGPPEKHLIEKSTRKKLFFDSMGKPRLTVSSKGRRRRPSSKTLQQVLKCDDEAFLDFLARCLRWDPERRLRPEDAIRHEFITGIKAPLLRDTSPIKRHHTISVPRPLPDPPGGLTGKSSAFSSARSGNSPYKPFSGSIRRVSGVTAATTASMNRRTSAGPAATLGTSSSGLPRAAGRVTSGRHDIATAGANAAMTRRS